MFVEKTFSIGSLYLYTLAKDHAIYPGEMGKQEPQKTVTPVSFEINSNQFQSSDFNRFLNTLYCQAVGIC